MSEFIGILPHYNEIRDKYPLSEKGEKSVLKASEGVRDIIDGKDPRKLLIIGPCSVDFNESILEYGKLLKDLQEEVKDKILIIMRFYTGKPRTTTGWAGIQESHPGEEPNLVKGIETARELAIKIIETSGLGLADEMLNTDNIKYFEDILSYHAVGARSTENQLHRKAASGLMQNNKSVGVGMKNPSSGDITTMINSIIAASLPHIYTIGSEIHQSTGNPYAHGILRGGSSGPNYSIEHIKQAQELFAKNPAIKNPTLIIDANHANSGKDPFKQTKIIQETVEVIKNNPDLNDLVKGFMVESYLFDGNQAYKDGCQQGLSITDPCIGKEGTIKLVRDLYNSL